MGLAIWKPGLHTKDTKEMVSWIMATSSQWTTLGFRSHLTLDDLQTHYRLYAFLNLLISMLSADQPNIQNNP